MRWPFWLVFKERPNRKAGWTLQTNEIEEEAPVVHYGYDPVPSVSVTTMTVFTVSFVKEVRDGKLGNYTLDTMKRSMATIKRE